MIEFPVLPVSVARKILFDGLHPLHSWSEYYSISLQELAELLEADVLEVRKLASSNLHLRKDWLDKICKTFGFDKNAIKIYHMDETGIVFKF